MTSPLRLTPPEPLARPYQGYLAGRHLACLGLLESLRAKLPMTTRRVKFPQSQNLNKAG